MNLLVIDPGLSVGWARFTDNKLHSWGIKEVDPNKVWPWKHEGVTSVTQVIYERFFISQVYQDTRTAELIGVLKYICAIRGIPCKSQEPSVLKFVRNRFFTGKEINYDTYHSHALSAIFHGIAYLHLQEMDVEPIVSQILKEV